MLSDDSNNENCKKLKKTQANHIVFSLLVGIGGLVLFGVVERFPNAEWSSVGMFWFLIVMVLGYIFR